MWCGKDRDVTERERGWEGWSGVQLVMITRWQGWCGAEIVGQDDEVEINIRCYSTLYKQGCLLKPSFFLSTLMSLLMFVILYNFPATSWKFFQNLLFDNNYMHLTRRISLNTYKLLYLILVGNKMKFIFVIDFNSLHIRSWTFHSLHPHSQKIYSSTILTFLHTANIKSDCFFFFFFFGFIHSVTRQIICWQTVGWTKVNWMTFVECVRERTPRRTMAARWCESRSTPDPWYSDTDVVDWQ